MGPSPHYLEWKGDAGGLKRMNLGKIGEAGRQLESASGRPGR